jgi:pyruvate formate lyase activating enzyme
MHPEEAKEPLATPGWVAGRVAWSTFDGPGNRYVVQLQGCGFDCLACQFPARIQPGQLPRHAQTVADTVEQIAAEAEYLDGVTISGGEPSRQPEFLTDLLVALRADRRTRRLTRFVDTNGDADPTLWDRLAPHLEGVLVDLKALDSQLHLVLTGQGNERVLAGIQKLSALDRLHEVRLLLIPGLNDSDRLLDRTATWLLAVDPQIRVRVMAFSKFGTRTCARYLQAPGRGDFVRYRRRLLAAGVVDPITP